MLINRSRIIAGLISLLCASCSAVPHRQACSKCGSELVTKRCRVSCETEQVPKTVYSTEKEEFCLPEHRHCAGSQEAEGCADDGNTNSPGCAKIYTRTKLTKKTTEVPVTKYKWTVVTDCPHCAEMKAGCVQLKSPPTP